MNRGDVVWASLPPDGRRPVVILTRSRVIPVRTRVTVAPITQRVRGIASEVVLGRREGLPARSAASCDNVQTIRKELLDPEPIGRLGAAKLRELDAALHFALGLGW